MIHNPANCDCGDPTGITNEQCPTVWLDRYRAMLAKGIHCAACEDCCKPVPDGICPDANCPFVAVLA